MEEPGLVDGVELDPLGEIPLDDPGLVRLPDPVWLSPAEPVAIAATIRSSRSSLTSIAARRDASVAPSVPPLRAAPLNPGDVELPGEVALLPGLPIPLELPGVDPMDDPGWRDEDEVPTPELCPGWLLAPPEIAPGLEASLVELEEPAEPGPVGLAELVPLLCPCAYNAPERESVAIMTDNFFI